MNEHELRRRKLDIARTEAEYRDRPGNPVPMKLPAVASDVEALCARVATLERHASTSGVRIAGLLTIALISSAATLGLFVLLRAMIGL